MHDHAVAELDRLAGLDGEFVVTERKETEIRNLGIQAHRRRMIFVGRCVEHREADRRAVDFTFGVEPARACAVTAFAVVAFAGEHPERRGFRQPLRRAAKCHASVAIGRQLDRHERFLMRRDVEDELLRRGIDELHVPALAQHDVAVGGVCDTAADAPFVLGDEAGTVGGFPGEALEKNFSGAGADIPKVVRLAVDLRAGPREPDAAVMPVRVATEAAPFVGDDFSGGRPDGMQIGVARVVFIFQCGPRDGRVVVLKDRFAAGAEAQRFAVVVEFGIQFGGVRREGGECRERKQREEKCFHAIRRA